MLRTYNTSLDIGEEVLQPPKSDEDYPLVSMKYVPLSQVKTTPYVHSLIRTCDIIPGYKHTLVDIKVHDLKKGQYPCIPGWHIDHRSKLVQDEVDQYALLITSDVSRTEFALDEIGSHEDDHTKIVVPESTRVWKVVPLLWHYYDSMHFHRSTPAIRDGKRILIRLCFTNKLGNTQHNFTPGVY